MGQSRRPGRFRSAFFHPWIAAAVLASPVAQGISVGGDVTLTSDYIFRGISESNGRGAAQLDLHVTTSGGSFAGAFASTLNGINGRGADYEVEAYLGHRLDLSPAWSTTFTAVDYSYLHGRQPFSNDYQELAAAVSYLDRWTVSLAFSPNAVRYEVPYRLGRYPTFVSDVSGQLPLLGRLFLAGGLGYYALDWPGGRGYAYGNAGVGFEYGPWRLDAAYYVIQRRAQELFIYGRAAERFAATLSWHF